jgi:hypothetical protein
LATARELRRATGRLLVAGTPVRDLLLCAKHLFVAAMAAGCGVIRLNEGGAELGYLKTLFPLERPALARRQGAARM